MRSIAESTAPGAERAARLRSLSRNPYVWAFLVGVVTLTLIRPLLRHEPPPPPVLGRLPAWTLVDAGGRPFGSAELAGRVWVAGFFFTRCTSICPRLTAAMGDLARRFDDAGVDGVALVSVTVDPEYDTPQRLRDYAGAHGIDSRRWSLLTGEPARVRELVERGFRVSVGEPTREGLQAIDIAHSGKLVLIDGSGGIRGYYDSDAAGLDEVFHRARHVLREAER